MAPSYHPLMEPSEASQRQKAIQIAEQKILDIITELEEAHNLEVTEIFPHDGTFYPTGDGVVICWHLNNREV